MRSALRQCSTACYVISFSYTNLRTNLCANWKYPPPFSFQVREVEHKSIRKEGNGYIKHFNGWRLFILLSTIIADIMCTSTLILIGRLRNPLHCSDIKLWYQKTRAFFCNICQSKLVFSHSTARTVSLRHPLAINLKTHWKERERDLSSFFLPSR